MALNEERVHEAVKEANIRLLEGSKIRKDVNYAETLSLIDLINLFGVVAIDMSHDEIAEAKIRLGLF
jgi:hypothetical protein